MRARSRRTANSPRARPLPSQRLAGVTRRIAKQRRAGRLRRPPYPRFSRGTGQRGEANGALTPIALATARRRAGARRQDRPLQIRMRAHARSPEAMDRARARGRRASPSTPRPPASTPCRPACAASRWPWRRTRPATCRSVIARAAAKRAPTCSRPRPSCARARSRRRRRLPLLKPLLEDKAVLKIGQNLKYDWLVFAQRGIEMRGYDDTMLISYVLDAGKGGHGMDDLAKRWLNHDTIHFQHVAGSGKSASELRLRHHREGDRIRRRRRRRDAAAVDALKPRLAAEHVATVYETLERAMPAVLARMERRGISIDRQVLSRLSGEFAQEQAGLEDEIQKLAGEPLNPGSPKQIGDILFGKMQLARRHQDPHRAMGDRRARVGGPGRTGPRIAAQDSRLAAGVEAALDLYRGAAHLRQPGDAPRAHVLRAGVHHAPAASPPPSPTCRTSRSAPRTAARSGRPSSPRPA